MENEMVEQQVGPATKLAQEVGQGLQKLSEMLAQAGGAPEEMDQMKQILDLYIDLVEKKLGGEEPEVEPQAPGAVPMEAGAGKAMPMGPQSRQ